MKICICSSLTFTDEVLEISKMLEAAGHEVLLPNGIINRLAERADFDPVQAKIDTNSNRLHAEKIRECDIVLMCNFLKNCTPGYIGANCFAELYLANYFEKPIFALFPLPDTAYINDEIRSFNITVLNGELKLLPSSDDNLNNDITDGSPADSLGSPRSGNPESATKSPILADPSALPPNPQAISASQATSDARDVPPEARDGQDASSDISVPQALSNPQTAPITSSSVPQPEPVHREVPGAKHPNPLQKVRDNWFSLWNKQKDGEA